MDKVYDRVSSGGVVVRDGVNGGREVLLLHKVKSDSWGYDSWHLPKGMMEQGELEEETAIREIFEETGYRVKIIKKLGSLESTYDDKSGKGEKLTHYYLCEVIECVGGLDLEHDNLKWVNANEAIDLLSEFPIWENEEEVVKLIL